MTQVILNVNTVFNGNMLKPGDSIDVESKTAIRWINRGIAHYAGYHEFRKTSEFKHISKQRQSEALNLNVICSGLMYGYSGFAEAMRNIAYSLYMKGCYVSVQPHDHVSSDILNTEKGRVINMLQTSTLKNDYKSVRITMTSPLGVVHKSNEYRIGYVMFETQETPKVFIDSLMINTDELWVPSTFNLNNFTKAGYTHPIFCMPLGVDIDRFNPDKVQPLNIGTDNKFVFLSIMGWSARKGVDILMEAYLREFSASDNTILYLKGGWYTQEKARNEVDQIVSKIGKKDPPEIKIDFNLYSDTQLPGLYKSANCFVLASLGEGWGLDYTEAMAMALPTIGTRATSQLDFMNDKNSFLIDVAEYRPEPRCDWICPQYRGGDFAIPSMEHLQKLMRQVYGEPELAKKIGQQARKDMIKKWQWKHASAKWYKRLKELEINL